MRDNYFVFQDVRIGSAETAQHSVDLEEALGGGGGSPPAAPRPSPPATPAPPADCEPLELQLDYWQVRNKRSHHVDAFSILIIFYCNVISFFRIFNFTIYYIQSVIE